MIPLPYRWIAIAAAIALGYGGWWLEHRSHASTKQDLATERAAADLARQINRDNAVVVNRLRDQLSEWEEYARSRDEQVSAALNQITLLSNQLNRSKDAERRARAQIYLGNADADSWGRAVVPDDIAERMRRHRDEVSDHPNGDD